MESPELAVQAAIVAALKASSDLAALVGGRVYDEVPAKTVAPFVRIAGQRKTRPAASTRCAPMFEVETDIEIWTEPPKSNGPRPGSTLAKRIGAAVETAIGDDTLVASDDFQPALHRWQSTTYTKADDGVSVVGIVTVVTHIMGN